MPLTSAPDAVANEPARLYQANTLVRSLSETICDRAACSIEACQSTYTEIAMRAAWRRGTYRVRLVYGPDGEVASDLAITLR